MGKIRVVVVVQLVERSLLTPEIRGSNSVIHKMFILTYLLLTVENTKIKKRGRELALLLPLCELGLSQFI